jgi:hypothetical protein
MVKKYPIPFKLFINISNIPTAPPPPPTYQPRVLVHHRRSTFQFSTVGSNCHALAQRFYLGKISPNG